MDIDGVDAEYLSNNEILELMDDIVDNDDEGMLILNNIDVKNLEEDKLQEIYDDVLYSSEKVDISKIINNLSDTQILDINRNIVDVEDSGVITLKGINMNVDSLSDEEISSLYDESLLADNQILIAKTNCTVDSDVTYYYVHGTAPTGSFFVTCPTSDTSVSTTGYFYAQLSINGYLVHGDDYGAALARQAIANGGGELTYVGVSYSSANYKVISVVFYFHYKYYDQYGSANYLYGGFGSGYDTLAK